VTLEKVTENIQEARNSLTETRAQAAEQWDKESRRNNLILYKVPERTQPRAEDRNEADIDFCIELFDNALHVGVSNEDFIHVFRLGKRGDDTAPTRHLLIQFASYTFKNLILESLSKLIHAEQKYNNVIVAHDMTKTEREECRKLVEKAKADCNNDTSGEYLYRVRGNPGQMRVVKIKLR